MTDAIDSYWERIRKPLISFPGSGTYTSEHPRWVAGQVLWALHNQISADARSKMWSLIPEEEIPDPDHYVVPASIVIDQDQDEEVMQAQYDARYNALLEKSGFEAANEEALKKARGKMSELYLGTFRSRLEEIVNGGVPVEISNPSQARLIDQIGAPIHDLKWSIKGEERGIGYLMKLILDEFPSCPAE